jgi:hypothetical protein
LKAIEDFNLEQYLNAMKTPRLFSLCRQKGIKHQKAKKAPPSLGRKKYKYIYGFGGATATLTHSHSNFGSHFQADVCGCQWMTVSV